MRTLAILGATGSIGRQALDIARRVPDQFRVTLLTAHSRAEALFELVREFRPAVAALTAEPDTLPEDVRFCQWYFGEDAVRRAVLAAKADDVLSAVVGVAGLPAAMAALDVSGRLLLANKESLVTGGALVMGKAAALHKPIVPVDSEHSAIFQCLQAQGGNPVSRLILTASGGPFRTWEKRDIERATRAQALGHPTWKMGAKITVDCAGMMNKGFEVIEAHHLFSMPMEKIDVIVHPQSVIHSMIEFEDGAVLAQLGAPDMRVPIGYAMGYPARIPFGGERLDFARIASLTFEAPDMERFPCLRMAIDAQKAGGVMPVALNGANEEAVAAFLDERIPFGGIARTVETVLARTENASVREIGDVYEADRRARFMARDVLRALV
ncbi:MAG: 1-deoxy-D-xylulose-5-phosphate reductoisomerase [Clostridiales bacterium]|nr:1-deoxy-D-xylulose-5-phosphate reductoisomerase [Clostridiales bacterium]MDY2872457.1 1-deoxy-D-xylulose-5-phosphate reductoisomerase [Eubacteriales bacterium]